MSGHDLIRVHHMLDAAREIIELTSSKDRSDLWTDRMLSLALIRLLEIIGEAASGISSGFRDRHPQVPWNAIIGMRNRLIHGYFDVDLDIIWKTMEDDIPDLIIDLERINTDQSETSVSSEKSTEVE